VGGKGGGGGREAYWRSKTVPKTHNVHANLTTTKKEREKEGDNQAFHPPIFLYLFPLLSCNGGGETTGKRETRHVKRVT